MSFNKYGHLDNITQREIYLVNTEAIIIIGWFVALIDAILSSFVLHYETVIQIHTSSIFYAICATYVFILLRNFYKFLKYSKLCKK